MEGDVGPPGLNIDIAEVVQPGDPNHLMAVLNSLDDTEYVSKTITGVNDF